MSIVFLLLSSRLRFTVLLPAQAELRKMVRIRIRARLQPFQKAPRKAISKSTRWCERIAARLKRALIPRAPPNMRNHLRRFR
jgi:hypothetical protein